MADYFQVKNPNYLGLVGQSVVPFPNQKEFGFTRGSGPVIDMCYTLFERNHGIPSDEAQSYPTIDDHNGWNIIGEGIFKGWEKQSKIKKAVPQNIWNPIMQRKDGDENRVLNSKKDRDLIKFKRVERRGRETKYLNSSLYWRKCKFYMHGKTMKKGKAKVKTLSRGDTGKLSILGSDMTSKIFAMTLGGKMHNKRSKSKRSKSKRSKSKRKKSKRKESKRSKSKRKTSKRSKSK